MPPQALLLVGHGTRNASGQQQFLRLANYLRAAVQIPLDVAFIELQSPGITDALVRCYEDGLRRIALAPALLFAAGHAKQDIPQAVAAAQARCPDLHVTIAEPLGCHPAVIELAARRFLHSLATAQPTSTALVVIGRGSSDPAAIEHCREFAQSLAQRAQAACVFTGFIAIAQPALAEALELAAEAGCEQICVQPHLLFNGEMLDTTTAAVERAKEKHPRLTWCQAGNLAGNNLTDDDASLLVEALLARLG